MSSVSSILHNEIDAHRKYWRLEDVTLLSIGGWSLVNNRDQGPTITIQVIRKASGDTLILIHCVSSQR